MNAHSANSRPWQLGTFVVALTLPLAALCLESKAAPPKTPSRNETVPPVDIATNPGTSPAEFSVPTGASTKIKLNYVKVPWSKVLKDYSTAVRKELRAETMPPGTYSRWDWKTYDVGDALRILNTELAGLGYHMIDKTDSLLLIEVKKNRKEYKPAVIPRDDRGTDDEAKADVEPVADAAPRRKANAASARRDAADAGRVEQAGNATRSPGKIRQMSGEREVPRAAAEPADLKVTAFTLKARDAIAVARIMRNALTTRTELIDAGPRGLPGFHVYRVDVDKQGRPLPRTTETPVSFTIGIDEDRNQLLVEADSKETASVLRLIRMLDVVPKPQTKVRAVSTSRDAGQIASSLRPELQRLAEVTRKAARRAQVDRAADEDAVDGDAFAQAPAQEEDAQPGRQRLGAGQPDSRDQPGGAQTMIQSLRGDVQIESIPELGIMVIHGSERDVETVKAVIEEIERLSVGTVPEVELVLLKNVNSEALSSLLSSVYARLSPSRAVRPGGPAQQQPQNVLIIPIVRPNAILIVASRVDIDSAVKLVDELDQPSDPRTEYKVFRLKYAVPQQVVDVINAMYSGTTAGGPGVAQQAQAAPTGALAPQVRVIDDPRSNSVIVQARPRDMREVAILIRDIDTQYSASVSVIKIFTLRTAAADELANTLNTAIQSLMNPARLPTTTQQGGGFGGGGGTAGGAQTGDPALREVKSTILEYLDTKDGRERTLQSGLLSDIRITPDLRTNSIVVTATQQSMDLIEELIHRFDLPTKAVAEIKVIPMTNGDAQSTVNLLNALFGAAATQRPPGQGGQQGGAQGGQNFPGLQVQGADDFSSSLIPLRFSMDIRTNAIIAIGGAEALRVVEAVIYRLDEGDIRARVSRVYKLKNTPALQVATAIQQFLQTQQQVLTADAGILSPFEQIEREVVVVAEPVSNSLLLSATPRFFEQVLELVEAIDKAPKEVMIQALLVEVALDNADEFGIELGVQDSILFQRSLLSDIQLLTTTTTAVSGQQTSTQSIVSQNGVPGYAFNNAPLGNNVTPNAVPNRVGGQALSNFNLQRANADLGYGGLVLAAGSDSVSALLRAVAARRRVDILSRPQIRTLDNQLANIQVGQEVPRVGNFTINATTGNATPVVEQRSIGIILQVTPRITPDQRVIMNVVARKDALSTQTVPLFLNPNGSTVNSPIIDTTNALTVVSVQSGQTVILGGMITKRDEVQERKIPVLGDIPILGQGFRYDFKRVVRTELLIFLTPRVLNSDVDSEMLKEIESQRINFIEAEAELTHGPLFGIPPESKEPSKGGLSSPIPSGPQMIPLPPAPPRAMPMSLDVDDPTVPTTRMRGQTNQIPAFPDDEDLEADLSSRQRAKSNRDSSVVSAAYDPADAPGRTSLNKTAAASKTARNQPKSAPKKATRYDRE